MKHLSIGIASYLWSLIGVWLALFSLQSVLVTTGVDRGVIDIPIAAFDTERASSALLGSIVILVGLRLLAWIWSEFCKNFGDAKESSGLMSPPLPFEENQEHPNVVLGKASRVVFVYFPVGCLVWLLGAFYVGEIWDHVNPQKQPYDTNPIVSRAVVTTEYFTTSKCTLYPTFIKNKPACQYRVGNPNGVTYIPVITDAAPLILSIYVFISYRRIFQKKCGL